MSWENQGRQEHGHFGHGTGSGAATDIGNLQNRIAWIAHASLMHLPRKEWHTEAATFDSQRTQRLQKAMVAWIGARSLNRAEFEKQFVGGSASDAAVDSLRAAAGTVRIATTHQDLGDASKHLADAMLSVGLNEWSGFLRDAADQADSYTPPAGNRVYAQLATNTATDASSGGSAATTASDGHYVASNPEQWSGRASVGTGNVCPWSSKQRAPLDRLSGGPVSRFKATQTSHEGRPSLPLTAMGIVPGTPRSIWGRTHTAFRSSISGIIATAVVASQASRVRTREPSALEISEEA